MPASNLTNGIHSADVRMELYLNGATLRVAQLGLDFLILQDPVDHPPAIAELLVSIDGHERRRPVHLIDGIDSNTIRTRIARPGFNGATVG